MSPRGRWSLVAGTEILTHTSTGTRLLHIIVYALLMHTQTRSESNENREIPSITTVCPLHGINIHNKSTIVCKCSDNLVQTNVYIKCNIIWIEVTHTHSHARTRTCTRQEKWREVAYGVGWQEQVAMERRVAGR